MVDGFCAPRFERLREEFERNFAERNELGASVCVVIDGEPVVDLWGGVRDLASGDPWERDTVNVIMSSSKGLAAMCTNMLLDRGQLDVDTPISKYWPEFAAHGKADITARQVLSHQSGVFNVSGTLPPGDFLDWDTYIRRIEETTPFWEPGTRAGYHGLTIGSITGELLRRIDGRTIGTFFRDEIAQPLDLDCWIGLPEEHEHRVAPSIAFDPTAPDVPPDVLAAMSNLMSNPLAAAMFAHIADLIPVWDTRAAHAAELPSSGAITNARGLAGAYTPFALGGSHNGVTLVSPATIAGMRYPQAVTDRDAVLDCPSSYTLGLSKSWRPAGALQPSGIAGNELSIGEDAFGTPGMGGQIGFADLHHRLAFAYTMNRHGTGTGLNARGQSLIDCVYTALGCPTKAPGFWVRP
jgi:CubicO group peptidase (beta-lactamase class C family)